MNRTQKKCFIMSAGFHGLLVLVLLFGTALMPHHEEENTSKIINLYSSKEVSMLLDTKGGDAGSVAAPEKAVKDPAPVAVQLPPAPQADPVKAAPEVVQPPKAEPVVKAKPVEPQHEVVKPHPEVVHDTPKPIVKKQIVKPSPKPITDDVPDKLKLVTKTKPEPRKFTLDPTELKSTKRNNSEADSQEKARKAQEAADAEAAAEAASARAAKKRALGAFASSLHSLNNNLSSATLVKTTPGIGGGGPMSVNYSSIIFSKYYNAWVAPVALADDTPKVIVSITISRDGNVTASRVIKASGIKLMDRSVLNTLENVTFIEPFPEGSTEKERTVTIEFNLEAKRQTG